MIDQNLCRTYNFFYMAERKRLIAASVLASDFTDIGGGVSLAENAGSDWIHLDIMDGSFVPPITFGSQMAKAVRKITQLPLDAHLMVVNPISQVKPFADAGVDRLTFHSESEIHVHRLATAIHDAGMKCGVSIVPSTPVVAITEILNIVDQVLIMTVNPGYGGQHFIPSTMAKVRTLADMRSKGAGDYLIVIDGGFCLSTASVVWEAGADVAVMGSALFDNTNPREALSDCRNVNLEFKK